MKTNRSLVTLAMLASLCCAPVAFGAANLALVARPSTSYVSGDTSTRSLNDGIEPQRSRDRRRGSYGN